MEEKPQNIEPITVFLIEGSPADALYIEELLDEAHYDYVKLIRAESLAESFKQLEENKVDVALLDMNLPDSRGLNTFLILHEKHPNH